MKRTVPAPTQVHRRQSDSKIYYISVQQLTIQNWTLASGRELYPEVEHVNHEGQHSIISRGMLVVSRLLLLASCDSFCLAAILRLLFSAAAFKALGTLSAACLAIAATAAGTGGQEFKSPAERNGAL